MQFLKWALPRLHLQWAGFRKVRRQVCKRIQRRIQAIDLADIHAYQELLATDEKEWRKLNELCRITISRFFRNREVFDYLGSNVLPTLAHDRVAAGDANLRVWSAGCGSGEEPYSLGLLWDFQLKAEFPDLRFCITATDSDPALLERADNACYPGGCLKEIPTKWIKMAFEKRAERYCIRPGYKKRVQFLQQDLRHDAPDGFFNLILCRNLVFTYFDEPLQRHMCRKLIGALAPGGAMVIGRKEVLPENGSALGVWSEACRIYQRPGACSGCSYTTRNDELP